MGFFLINKIRKKLLFILTSISIFLTIFSTRGGKPTGSPGSLKTDATKAAQAAGQGSSPAVAAGRSRHGGSVWTDAVKMDRVWKRMESMLKRTADWLEKMSVAAMAVGIFQGQPIGIFLGVACFAASLYLTKKLGG